MPAQWVEVANGTDLIIKGMGDDIAYDATTAQGAVGSGAWLGRVNDAVQRLMETWIPVSEIPPGDTTGTLTPQQLQDLYGVENIRFENEQGTSFLVFRNTIVSFTWDGASLVPFARRAR